MSVLLGEVRSCCWRGSRNRVATGEAGVVERRSRRSGLRSVHKLLLVLRLMMILLLLLLMADAFLQVFVVVVDRFGGNQMRRGSDGLLLMQVGLGLLRRVLRQRDRIASRQMIVLDVRDVRFVAAVVGGVSVKNTPITWINLL